MRRTGIHRDAMLRHLGAAHHESPRPGRPGGRGPGPGHRRGTPARAGTASRVGQGRRRSRPAGTFAPAAGRRPAGRWENVRQASRGTRSRGAGVGHRSLCPREGMLLPRPAHGQGHDAAGTRPGTPSRPVAMRASLPRVPRVTAGGRRDRGRPHADRRPVASRPRHRRGVARRILNTVTWSPAARLGPPAPHFTSASPLCCSSRPPARTV